MVCKNVAVLLFAVTLVLMAVSLQETKARYLPPRGSGDRIDKLRELLKELLESEIEREDQDAPPRYHPENKLFYKREISHNPTKH